MLILSNILDIEQSFKHVFTINFIERYNHSIEIREYDHNYNSPEHLAKEMKQLMRAPLRDSNGLFEDFKPETICDIILKEVNE